MNAPFYYLLNALLVYAPIALLFFFIGLLIGWFLWRDNWRRAEAVQRENEKIAKRLEAARREQTKPRPEQEGKKRKPATA